MNVEERKETPDVAYEEWAKKSPRLGRMTAVRVFPGGRFVALSWDENGDPYFTDPYLVAEFMAILGFAPSGYRLVPEQVAHEAIQQALDDPNDGYVWVPLDTWEALVSALQGEVEKR